MKHGVQFHNITHSFDGLVVLDNISINLEVGEFVAIIGPSGCGKSTLLRLLAGLWEPSSGRIDAGTSSRLGKVAYLPQGDSLLPWRRAVDNASIGLEASGVPRNEARQTAHELFADFGLEGFEEAWPHELSGGMRQRVGVLRTFLLPHPVLCLDEPFGALDAMTRRDLQGWLRRMWARDRRTTILVTHDVEEALLLADRVLVMTPRPGRIADVVSAGELDDERPVGIETTPEFVDLKRRLLKSLSTPPA